MKSVNIHFLGSPADYSQKVKKDLEKAGYSTCKDSLCRQTPDLIITACHGQIIPQKTLRAPKYGALNIHPSLLPKYRGAAPVPWTLLNKETETGVTIFKMDQGIDTGPILAQEKTSIKPQKTSQDLLNRLFKLGTKLLIDILPGYIEDKISPISQPKKSPTPYARKLTKLDGFVKWPDFIKASASSFTSLDHQIRALYPWPGTWTKLPNDKTLKLLPVRPNCKAVGGPNNLFQLEGKSPISWQQFQNGYKQFL